MTHEQPCRLKLETHVPWGDNDKSPRVGWWDLKHQTLATQFTLATRIQREPFKAVKLALAYHRSQAEHAIWQRHVFASLGDSGLSLPVPVGTTPSSERWQCDLCHKIFASSRALAMHASRDHGYRKQVRYCASGDTCPVCCQLFHTRQRLSIHFEKNPKCYDVVQHCWPPMPSAMVQALDAEDQSRESELRKNGWWASKAFEPVRQTLGASLPPLQSHEAKLMYDKMHSRRPPELAFQQLQGRRIDQTTSSPPAFWWTRDDLPAFVVHSPCAQGTDRGAGAFDMSGLAREAARLHIRSLVVVHFFSGYRRHEDIHHILDQHVHRTGAHVSTISVDFCLQRQHADLATHQSVLWWTESIRSGQVVSAGGDINSQRHVPNLMEGHGSSAQDCTHTTWMEATPYWRPTAAMHCRDPHGPCPMRILWLSGASPVPHLEAGRRGGQYLGHWSHPRPQADALCHNCVLRSMCLRGVGS